MVRSEGAFEGLYGLGGALRQQGSDIRYAGLWRFVSDIHLICGVEIWSGVRASSITEVT